MNKILIAAIIGCYCAILVESFFSASKVTDGCHPNPCQHKGTCQLDSKDKYKYTCSCTSDYHGKNCTEKIGCASKPCKHDGVCTVNPLNKTAYTCKCTGAYVGENCQTKNSCEPKNPCKHDGKCMIDKKSGKHYCECKPGWGHEHCDKQVCNVTEMTLKQKTKKSLKVYLDEGIKSNVKDLDDLAKLCKVHLHVLQSFILHPDQSKAYTYDVREKNNPNFYTGKALRVHLYDTKDNLLCNDVCLGKIPVPVSEAKCFLDGLYAIKWKMSHLDPGCIHTDHYAQNMAAYNRHREHFQKGCQGKKFA